jgi:hypothetical protein
MNHRTHNNLVVVCRHVMDGNVTRTLYEEPDHGLVCEQCLDDAMNERPGHMDNLHLICLGCMVDRLESMACRGVKLNIVAYISGAATPETGRLEDDALLRS